MCEKIVIIGSILLYSILFEGCAFYKTDSLVRNGKIAKALVKSENETVIIITSPYSQICSIVDGRVTGVVNLGNEKVLQIEQNEFLLNISNFDSIFIDNRSLVKVGDTLGTARKENNQFEIAIRILKSKEFLNAKEIWEFLELKQK